MNMLSHNDGKTVCWIFECLYSQEQEWFICYNVPCQASKWPSTIAGLMPCFLFNSVTTLFDVPGDKLCLNMMLETCAWSSRKLVLLNMGCFRVEAPRGRAQPGDPGTAGPDGPGRAGRCAPLNCDRQL
jgi:hypothetical protein